MPHPTPVHIAFGSATVISTTMLLLLLVPEGSTLALLLVAMAALLLGVAVVVALGLHSQRDARAAVPGAAAPPVPARRVGFDAAPPAAATAPRATRRTQVRV